MDSLNLSETQNTSLNSKSTACNTSPIACAYCGSKYYMQILPQPYCYRVQNSDISNCKHTQECFEENFTNLQPSFSPFPFLHPFFNNSPFPIPSYIHNPLNDGALKQEKKEYANDNENRANFTNKDTFCQKEKTEFKGNKNTVNEATQKHNDAPGPESQTSGCPFNFMDPNFHSVAQRTGWGDFIPWTCSPFIAPMISYCLFWNSQKFNGNNLLKNSNGNIVETLQQKYNENTNQENLNAKNYNKESSKDFEEKYINKRISSTEMKNCSLEESEEVKSYNNHSNENLIADSVNSELNYSSQNSFTNTEKEGETFESLKASSDSFCGGEGEEDAETEGFDSVVQVESDDCFKIDGRDLLNFKTSSSLLIEPNDNINNNQVQCSAKESEFSYLMARKNSETAMDISTSEVQVTSSDASATEENTCLSFQDNENEKTTSVTESSALLERTPSKKPFKNFTMADQNNDNFFNKTKISVAAAGDLGGVHCEGYKLTISLEKNEEENAVRETKPEEGPESKELVSQDTEEKNKLNNLKKNLNENSKSIRSLKSGIAKLSSSSKLKESKTHTIKTFKYNKEYNQKEMDSVKRKHNCVFNSNTVNENEKSSKIQRMRNYAMSQKKIPGPEKQNKELISKGSNKKEKKFQRLKF